MGFLKIVQSEIMKSFFIQYLNNSHKSMLTHLTGIRAASAGLDTFLHNIVTRSNFFTGLSTGQADSGTNATKLMGII